MYDFGRVRSGGAAGGGAEHLRGARALLGPRTDLVGTGDRASESAPAPGAVHFVVEGDEGATGVRAARTHFLRGGGAGMCAPDAAAAGSDAYDVAPGAGGDGDDGGGAAEEKGGDDGGAAAAADAALLGGVYAALCRAYDELMETRVALVVTAGGGGGGAAGAAAELVAHVGAALAGAGGAGARVRVDVELCDACGGRLDARALDRAARCVAYVRIDATGLAGPGGAPLGAVTYGDTHVLALRPGAPRVAAGLTRGLPRTRFWLSGGGGEAAAQALLRRALASRHARGAMGLGEALATSTRAHAGALLLSPSDLAPLSEGAAALYETGLVFTFPDAGALALSFERGHVTAVRLASPPAPAGDDDAAAVAEGGGGPLGEEWGGDALAAPKMDLLLLELSAGAPRPPRVAPGAPCALAIALPDGSALKSDVLRALSRWRREVGYAARATAAAAGAEAAAEEEGDEAASVAAADAAAAAALSSLAAARGSLAVRGGRGAVVAAFRAALLADAAAAYGYTPSPAGAAAAVPARVLIITGGPCSGKGALAEALAEGSRDAGPTRVVDLDAPGGDGAPPVDIDVPRLVRAVAAAAAAGGPGVRVILVAPGFADAVSVASAVEGGGAPGVVVGCVAAVNARLAAAEPRGGGGLPREAEACARGWVGTVVLTEAGGVPEAALGALRARLRAVNPEARFVRAEGHAGGPLALPPGAAADAAGPGAAAAFASPRARFVRALVAPGWADRARFAAAGGAAAGPARLWDGVFAPLDREVTAAFVPVCCCVERPRLERALAGLVTAPEAPAARVLGARGALPASWARSPAVWAAVGALRLCEAPAGGAARVDAAPGHLRVGRPAAAAGAAPRSGVAVYGWNVASAGVAAVLRGARPPLPDMTPLRDVSTPPPPPTPVCRSRRRRCIGAAASSRGECRAQAASLSRDELDAIAAASVGTPLPPGVFFDGRQYMDYTGVASRVRRPLPLSLPRVQSPPPPTHPHPRHMALRSSRLTWTCSWPRTWTPRTRRRAPRTRTRSAARAPRRRRGRRERWTAGHGGARWRPRRRRCRCRRRSRPPRRRGAASPEARVVLRRSGGGVACAWRGKIPPRPCVNPPDM